MKNQINAHNSRGQITGNKYFMTTQIDLIINDSQKVVIEFLDNDFTAEFIPHLKNIYHSYEFASHKMFIPPLRSGWDNNAVESQRQEIIKSVSVLNLMGLHFPVPIENIVFDGNTKETRQLLNRLHRCFTTGNFTRNTWEYNTDSTFCVSAEDQEYFNTLVHNINTAVHRIEFYTTNERVQTFPKYSEYIVEFISQKPKNPNNQPVFFKDIKEQHFDYFSDKLDYDVWLPLTQIQGKDYWRGYFDYDDPTCWDISTNIVYSGSLALGDRSGAKYQILEDWMRSYGIEPGPRQCGMPLGHIVEGGEYLNSIPDINAFKDIVIQ